MTICLGDLVSRHDLVSSEVSTPNPSSYLGGWRLRNFGSSGIIDVPKSVAEQFFEIVTLFVTPAIRRLNSLAGLLNQTCLFFLRHKIQ